MDKFFGIKEKGSTVSTEIIAGITTFFAMAYIIFVNPSILGVAVPDGPDKMAMLTSITIATCLSAAIGTLIMSLYAKLPFALAPGMGLNAFFTFTICIGMNYTYNQALAAVFISGVLFIIITLLGWREMAVKAIPVNIKYAISAGIGLFIALIGFKNAGLVVANPDTLLGLGVMNDFSDVAVRGAILALIGIVLIAVLMKFNIKGAILIGIAVCAVAAYPLGIADIGALGSVNWSFNLAPTFLKMDFGGLLNVQNGVAAMLGSVFTIILSLSLVDMFDTIGTLIGTAEKADMIDENGEMPGMGKAMMADAIATVAGACLGTSTVTTYVESSAGIAEGGKTGLTSLVVAILFLIATFVSPVAAVVPSVATAPALIIVGVLMMGSLKKIDFSDMTEALPAFFTIVFMPFTYSIANGIAFGLITYCLAKIGTGQAKKVSWVTYLLAALFIIRFVFVKA